MTATSGLIRATYVVWQERRDSNPRPLVLETSALPTELRSSAIRHRCPIFLCYWKDKEPSTIVSEAAH